MGNPSLCARKETQSCNLRLMLRKYSDQNVLIKYLVPQVQQEAGVLGKLGRDGDGTPSARNTVQPYESLASKTTWNMISAHEFHTVVITFVEQGPASVSSSCG